MHCLSPAPDIIIFNFTSGDRHLFIKVYFNFHEFLHCLLLFSYKENILRSLQVQENLVDILKWLIVFFMFILICQEFYQ